MSNPAIQGRATRFATDNPLNSPIWAALNSSHRKFAHGGPLALRYFPDVAPFGALADRTAEAFAALATLVPRDGRVVLQTADALVPFSGLKVDMQKPILQMVLDAPVAASLSGPDHMVLGHTDVDAMMDLADRTRPGPFGSGTIDLGRYIGIRFDEVLAAMAGEVGLGIAASGTIIPKLLLIGLKETWIGLGVFFPASNGYKLVWLARCAASCRGPNQGGPLAQVRARPTSCPLRTVRTERAWRGSCDDLAGRLRRSRLERQRTGRRSILDSIWRSGYHGTRGLRIVRRSHRISLFLPCGTPPAGDRRPALATSSSTISLVIGTTILGAFTPGIIPLVLGRTQEIVRHDHAAQRQAWSHAATAFALFQALGGYGYSYLFGYSGQDYSLLFAIGAGVLVLALLSDFVLFSDGEQCRGQG